MTVVALTGNAERFWRVSSMINLTVEQIQLAKIIDAHVNHFPDTALGTEHLLPTIYKHIETFKRILDSTTSVQLDYLCQQYNGLCRFAKLLESMAQGISDGVFDMPKDH